MPGDTIGGFRSLALDRQQGDHRFQDAPPPRCDQAEIKVGDRLDLTLKDGRHMRGHFRNLDCGSDSCMVLGLYMGNSWDVGFGRTDTQRIPISEIQNIRVPNHSFERQAVAAGIFTDAVLMAVVLSRIISGLRSLGT